MDTCADELYLSENFRQGKFEKDKDCEKQDFFLRYAMTIM